MHSRCGHLYRRCMHMAGSPMERTHKRMKIIEATTAGTRVSPRMPSAEPLGSAGLQTASSLSALQRLYVHAQRILKPHQQPTPQQVQELRQLAAAVTLPEVGFPTELLKDPSLVVPYLQSQDRNHPFVRGHVTYLHIYDCAAFSLGIFCLPAGTSIPLHDHPGMTVISHLLFGSMHVRAYDPASSNLPDPTSPPLTPSQCDAIQAGSRVEQLGTSRTGPHSNGSRTSRNAFSSPTSPGRQADSSWGRMSSMAASVRECLWGSPTTHPHRSLIKAQKKFDGVITAPTDAMVLLPDSCNIHHFSALQHCAVLDLLTPPYDEAQGRDCTYYREVRPAGSPATHTSPSQAGQMVHLEAIESTFYTKNAPYTGATVP